jgi:hypothetical protein
VVTNCEVAADKLHVPALSFARIGKRAILLRTVTVPKLATRIAREKENEGRRLRRANTSLLLSTIYLVDIPAPIVALARLEIDNSQTGFTWPS